MPFETIFLIWLDSFIKVCEVDGGGFVNAMHFRFARDTHEGQTVPVDEATLEAAASHDPLEEALDEQQVIVRQPLTGEEMHASLAEAAVASKTSKEEIRTGT